MPHGLPDIIEGEGFRTLNCRAIGISSRRGVSSLHLQRDLLPHKSALLELVSIGQYCKSMYEVEKYEIQIN